MGVKGLNGEEIWIYKYLCSSLSNQRYKCTCPILILVLFTSVTPNWFFFSPWYSTNCYKTILLLMLFLLTITAQQTDQVYMKGSLDSTLKGISIYFITEWIFCIPDESWLQNSWSFVQPLLVSFHKITWASKLKC